MGRRINYMFPASTAIQDPGEGDKGGHINVEPNGSGYGGSPQMELWEAWADSGVKDYPQDPHPCGGPSGHSCSLVYFWPVRTTGGNAHALVGFDRPPTQVLYEKLTFRCWYDYSQQGPNNWYTGAPNNSYAPRIRFVMRNRANDGYLYDGTWYTVDGTNNCRITSTNCGAAYVSPTEITWELLAHPEGGPFTLEDMIALKAGVNIDIDGPAFDGTEGSFFKFRTFHFHLEVETEDLGGYVDNMRNATARWLRIQRRGRREVKLIVPADLDNLELGQVHGLEYSRGLHPEGRGWGHKPLERRLVLPMRRERNPELLTTSYGLMDLREIACLLWASYRIDLPWGPDLSGLAWLDQGGGFSTARNQDAWSPRQGDGVLMRVLPDYLPLDYEGMPVCGPDDVELVLRNYNPNDVAWSSVGVSGGLTFSDDVDVVMVDELGYTPSCRFTFGGTAGQGGKEQSIGTIDHASGILLHVFARVRNVSVDTPGSKFMEFVLKRDKTVSSTPVTEYFDFAAGTWGTSPVYNPFAASEPSAELLADAVPCDTTADSAPTYTVQFGRFSSAISNAVFVAGLASAQKATTAIKDYGLRPPLVSLDATVTRIEDVPRIENPSTARVWYGGRGTFVGELRPFWRASLLTEDKPIMYARHSASEYDRLDFLSSSALRFRRYVSAVAYDVSVNVSTVLTRAHVLRFWCRWLDDAGWEDLAPYAISVGFAVLDWDTGERLEQGVAHASGPAAPPTLDADAYLHPGHDGAAAYLDGWIRWLETTLSPLAESECLWRR